MVLVMVEEQVVTARPMIGESILVSRDDLLCARQERLSTAALLWWS